MNIRSWIVRGLIAAVVVVSGPPAGAAQNLTYTYDAAGRLTSVTYDDALRTTFTYDLNGNLLSIETAPVTADVPGGPEITGLPSRFGLGPGAPNPLRGSSVLRYELPRTSPVRLEVYSPGGRRLRTLLNGTVPAGYHRAAWDGRDGQGRAVPSGIYFVRFTANEFVESRSIAVVR